MTTTQICSDCEEVIEEPVHANGNYVIHTDFAEPEVVEVVYEMRHTQKTKKKLDAIDEKLEDRDRQALAAEAAHPEAPAKRTYTKGTEKVQNNPEVEGDDSWTETAIEEEIDFSIPVEEFEHVETDNPNSVQDDDEVAITYKTNEERAVQKTAVVCPGCTKEDAEIIWGPDKQAE